MSKNSRSPEPHEPSHPLVDRQGRPIALGGALRRAWVGYQQRLDQEMAAAGFADRRLPDGRVLRICARAGEVTAAQIARELGMSRQGAGKIITALSERGYVELRTSETDARERAITLTPRAHEYLGQQRRAAARIEQTVREQLGDEAIASLAALLDVLTGDDEPPRLRDYLGRAARREP